METNEQLAAEFPQWNMPVLYEKTGIAQRHIAAPDECSSDMGVAAARTLFATHDVDPRSIDFLLFCTQTPDYPLPTTACLMQDRLGLRRNCGALDFNMGCSGFVYGLALADGLIRGGTAGRILLVTAETYSKFIHPTDRSLRTIFGDGAAATLIEPADAPTLSGFQYGTDGSGADTLMVTKGGVRPEKDAHKPRNRRRWPSDLYMDGPSLLSFTVGTIPEMVEHILEDQGVTKDQIGLYLFHQATHKMLDQLRRRLGVEESRMPELLRDLGNTVSATIPILISEMRAQDRLVPDRPNLLIGFGVGWSWAGCLWRDVRSECR